MARRNYFPGSEGFSSLLQGGTPTPEEQDNLEIARNQRNVELNHQLTQSMQDLSNIHRQNTAYELEQKGIQQAVAVLPVLKDLDPASDDYDKQLTGALAANPYASQDPAVQKILQVQNSARSHFLETKDKADTFARSKAERDSAHADTLRAGAAQSGLLKEYDAAVAGDPTRGIKGMDPIAATAHVVNVGQNNQQYNQMKQLGFTDQEIFEHKDQNTGLLDPAKAQESILQKQKEIIPAEIGNHAINEVARIQKKEDSGVELSQEDKDTRDTFSQISRAYGTQLLKNRPIAAPEDIKSVLNAPAQAKGGISQADIDRQKSIAPGLDWQDNPVKPGDKGWMPSDEINAINNRRDAFLKQNNVTKLDTIPTDIGEQVANKPDALFHLPNDQVFTGKEIASAKPITSIDQLNKANPDDIVGMVVNGKLSIKRAKEFQVKDEVSGSSPSSFAVSSDLPQNKWDREIAIAQKDTKITKETEKFAAGALDPIVKQKKDAIGVLDSAEKSGMSPGDLIEFSKDPKLTQWLVHIRRDASTDADFYKGVRDLKAQLQKETS